jgi:hypothetical protein
MVKGPNYHVICKIFWKFFYIVCLVNISQQILWELHCSSVHFLSVFVGLYKPPKIWHYVGNLWPKWHVSKILWRQTFIWRIRDTHPAIVSSFTHHCCCRICLKTCGNFVHDTFFAKGIVSWVNRKLYSYADLVCLRHSEQLDEQHGAFHGWLTLCKGVCISLCLENWLRVCCVLWLDISNLRY